MLSGSINIQMLVHLTGNWIWPRTLQEKNRKYICANVNIVCLGIRKYILSWIMQTSAGHMRKRLNHTATRTEYVAKPSLKWKSHEYMRWRTQVPSVCQDSSSVAFEASLSLNLLHQIGTTYERKGIWGLLGFKVEVPCVHETKYKFIQVPSAFWVDTSAMDWF